MLSRVAEVVSHHVLLCITSIENCVTLVGTKGKKKSVTAAAVAATAAATAAILSAYLQGRLCGFCGPDGKHADGEEHLPDQQGLFQPWGRKLVRWVASKESWGVTREF